MALAILSSCAGSGANKGKLNFISVDEELALGKELVIKAHNNFNIIRNQRINAFFNKMCQEIGVHSEWSGLSYQVYLINEPDLNHFSLPGGAIFLYRGLIAAADSASEIALIISHEIAHIAARDGVDRVSTKYGYAFAAQSVMGENPEIASQIISNLTSEGTILDYPDRTEYLADKTALKNAWKANYDPNSLVDILTKIEKLEKQDPSLIGRLYFTHPPASDRIKRIIMQLSQIPRKSTLRQDLAEFQEIKKVLQRIPM